MAINSLNASSNGLSGLVSGLNTEDFVSKLLAGTQSKIDMAKTQKTQLLYKRDLYRTVNSSIRSLQSKYFSFASTNNTNLLSSAFFKSFSATSSNDKVLSVNATNVANAGKYNIKVEQLAQNMSVSSKDPVSGAIKGEFNLEDIKKQLTEGKEVKFKLELDGVTKEIVISGKDINDADKLKKAIESQISTKLGSGITVKVTNGGSNGKSTITFDTTGNRTLTFASDSKELGISSGASNRINLKSALDKTGLASKIEGDRFEFSINGVDFSFDKSTSVGRIIENVNASEAGVTLSYSALSDSFKIESNVGGDGSKIELKQTSGNLLTVMFGDDVIDKADSFSTPGLTITNPGKDPKPEDNVISGKTTLDKLGLKGGTLTIGDKSIKYEATMTIDQFNAALEAENISAEIGLNVTPPRFIFAGTKLPIPVSIGPASAAGNNGDAEKDFNILFGSNNIDKSSNGDKVVLKQPANPKKSVITTSGDKVTVTKDNSSATELKGNNFVAGKSAILTINDKKIERNSNTLTEEGLSLELHETGETVITISSDNDKVFDGIKAFMDDYNKLVDEIWTYIKEDPSYKEYAPLTAEQKAEMTDKEIELWEKKSKEGLLRADPTLRAITDSMREVLNTRVGGVSLADLGITTSYDFEKGYGGKLVFSDSTGDKLRESIASDPDKLKNLFLEADGISSKFNDVLNAATTPGKAGSKHYSLSLVDIAGSTGSNDTSSKIYSDMNNIDKNIAKLERKYQSEYSRYWKQFNAMEQMISQMNQQSGWLSQQMM